MQLTEAQLNRLLKRPEDEKDNIENTLKVYHHKMFPLLQEFMAGEMPKHSWTWELILWLIPSIVLCEYYAGLQYRRERVDSGIWHSLLLLTQTYSWTPLWRIRHQRNSVYNRCKFMVNLISIFSFVGNNRNPPITEKIIGPLISVRAGFNCNSHVCFHRS